MGIEWGSTSAIMDFRGVFYNIIIEFGIPLNLVTLNKNVLKLNL